MRPALPLYQCQIKTSQEEKTTLQYPFPGSSAGKESVCNAGFNPWVGKIPWRAWRPTPVFLSGESPWTEEPGGLYSPWGRKESDTTELLSTAQHLL